MNLDAPHLLMVIEGCHYGLTLRPGAVEFHKGLRRKPFVAVDTSPMSEISPEAVPPARKLYRSITFASMVGRREKVSNEPFKDAVYVTDKVKAIKGTIRMAAQIGRNVKKPHQDSYQSQIQLFDYGKMGDVTGLRVKGSLPFDRVITRDKEVPHR